MLRRTGGAGGGSSPEDIPIEDTVIEDINPSSSTNNNAKKRRLMIEEKRQSKSVDFTGDDAKQAQSSRTVSPPPSLPQSPVFKAAAGCAQMAPGTPLQILKKRVIRKNVRLQGPKEVIVRVQGMMGGQPFTKVFQPTDTVSQLHQWLAQEAGVAEDKQILTFQHSSRKQPLSNPTMTLGALAAVTKGPLNLLLGVKMFTGQDLLMPLYPSIDEIVFYEDYDLEVEVEYEEGSSSEELDSPQDEIVQNSNPELIKTIVAPIQNLIEEPIFCFFCSVKCRLAANYRCKECKKTFCPQHRYPNVHACCRSQ